MITIIAEFKIKSDKTAEFIKHATDVTRETRKEKGCLSYKVLTAREDKTRFTFVEEWLNDVSISEHNRAPHFLKFLDSIKPLLNEEIKITQFEKMPSVFF